MGASRTGDEFSFNPATGGTPVTPVTAPATTVIAVDQAVLTSADARSRSVRVLAAGLGFDLLFALGTVAGTLTGEEFFTRAGLATLAVLVVKTALQTAATYIARFRFPPTATIPAPPPSHPSPLTPTLTSTPHPHRSLHRTPHRAPRQRVALTTVAVPRGG